MKESGGHNGSDWGRVGLGGADGSVRFASTRRQADAQFDWGGCCGGTVIVLLVIYALWQWLQSLDTEELVALIVLVLLVTAVVVVACFSCGFCSARQKRWRELDQLPVGQLEQLAVESHGDETAIATAMRTDGHWRKIQLIEVILDAELETVRPAPRILTAPLTCTAHLGSLTVGKNKRGLCFSEDTPGGYTIRSDSDPR